MERESRTYRLARIPGLRWHWIPDATLFGPWLSRCTLVWLPDNAETRDVSFAELLQEAGACKRCFAWLDNERRRLERERARVKMRG